MNRSYIASWLIVLVISANAIVACSKHEPNALPATPTKAILDAAKQGDVEAIRIQIDIDPSSIDSSDEEFRTPLMLAARNGHFQAVDFLLSKVSYPDSVSDSQHTAIYSAAMGPIERVEQRILLIDRLLKEGARLNTPQEDARKPAFGATMKGDSKMLQYLVEKGADVKEDHTGDTLLHRLAMSEVSKASEPGEELRNCLRIILDVGIDIETRNEYGETPLFFAATFDSLSLIKLLIENGTDVNTVNNGNDSPLNVAVGSYSLDLVKLLVENGADVNHIGALSLTPLQQAKKLIVGDIAKYLESLEEVDSD